MEELFSDARSVWPFYGDVKLISDRRGGGVGGTRVGGGDGREREMVENYTISRRDVEPAEIYWLLFLVRALE